MRTSRRNNRLMISYRLPVVNHTSVADLQILSFKKIILKIEERDFLMLVLYKNAIPLKLDF